MIHLQEGWALNTYRFINNDAREWKQPVRKVQRLDWKLFSGGDSVVVIADHEDEFGDVKVPYTLKYTLYRNGEISIFPVCRCRPF